MTSPFQVGGAVRTEALYVRRSADTALPAALLDGVPCVVLGPRQLGKSSLCLRVASHLQAAGQRVALVDCTRLGTADATPDGWLFGLAEEIASEIGARDPEAYWTNHARVAPLRRWLGWLHERLVEDERSLTLLLDEVDVLQGLPFGPDEVLGGLRAAHEARARDPVWSRFTAALLGVASPATLGGDPARTPMNVSRVVPLDDFTEAEARSLLPGLAPLGPAAPRVLDEVLAWTSGHPWMTTRLCHALATEGADAVDDAVSRLFVERGVLTDVCLHASARQLESGPGLERRLERYAAALRGVAGPVRPTDADLVLTGMVASRQGTLQVRNRVFATVFDAAWVADRRSRRSVARVAARWVQAGRRDVDVLRGQALDEVSTWAQDRSDLSPDEAALLLRSTLVARDEGLAEARQIAQGRRLRTAVGALVVVCAALVVTGGALLGQARAVRQQTALSTAQAARLLAAVPKQQSTALSEAQAAVALEVRPATVHALVEALHAAAGRRIQVTTEPLDRVACAPAGDHVVTSAANRVWQVRLDDGQVGRRSAWPAWAAPPEIPRRTDPDGRAWVVAPDGTEQVLHGHLEQVLALARSPDERLLATAADDDAVRLWDARTGRPLGRFVQHRSTVRAVAFCADGHRVVSASDDGTVGIWHAVGGLADLRVTRARWGGFTPGGALLTTGPGGTWVGDPPRLLSADDGDGVHIAGGHAIISGDTPFLTVVDLTPGGSPRALPGWTSRWPGTVGGGGTRVASQEGAIARVWSLDPVESVLTVPAGAGPLWSVALSPDGTRVVAAGDRGARMFDAATGALVATLIDQGVVAHAQFSPDGSWVATAGYDRVARLFDGRTGAAGPQLGGHEGRLPMLAFSADSQRLVTPSFDGTASIWAVPTGALLHRLTGHGGLIRAAAWSPDGARVATAGDDGTIRIFDAATGAPWAVLRTHRSPVRTVAFSPDGARLVSAEDGLVAVQPVTLAAWQRLAGAWRLAPAR